MITKEEIENALIERNGLAVQKKLASSTVAVCGLGGLGSNIALALARAGVGRLILIDFDKVDISNLNRQQYTIDQIGMYKTDAMRQNIMNISPYIDITLHCEKLESHNVVRSLIDTDIICEAFDSPECKAMLIDTVFEKLSGKYVVASSGMAGPGACNDIQTRKLTAGLYICGDGKSDVDEVGSLFASRVMICAGHQAHTAIRILLNEFDI